MIVWIVPSTSCPSVPEAADSLLPLGVLIPTMAVEARVIGLGDQFEVPNGVVRGIAVNVVNIHADWNGSARIFPNAAMEVFPIPGRASVVTAFSEGVLPPTANQERKRSWSPSQLQAAPGESLMDRLSGYAKRLRHGFATVAFLVEGIHRHRRLLVGLT